MAKKRVEKPKHKPTKRQLSRWQRQKRRQKIILGIGISVVIAALGLVTAGVYFQWYLPEVRPFRETVIEVNDTKFNMGYYIDALKFHLGDQPPQYIQYFLDPVVESIQQNELIRQETLELGITVSDDEVKEKIKSDNLPDNQAVRDTIRAQLLIQKLRDEYFELQVPVSAEQRYVMAMFVESGSQADDIRGRLEDGEDFGEIAGELSLDSFTQMNNGDMGWRPSGVLNGLLNTSILDDLIFGYQVEILSHPIYDSDKSKDLGYWLVQVLEKKAEPEEAHVQGIMLASEEEAQTVISRLETGEDFVELAEEFSQRWSDIDGADLGWLTPGGMSQAFDDFVFNTDTELNTTSEPILGESTTTQGGYWLFRVEDSDNREISDEDRDLLVDQALNDWLASLLDDPENDIASYLDEEMWEFAIAKILET